MTIQPWHCDIQMLDVTTANSYIQPSALCPNYRYIQFERLVRIRLCDFLERRDVLVANDAPTPIPMKSMNKLKWPGRHRLRRSVRKS